MCSYCANCSGGKRPFGHFAVRAVGQIDFAHRRDVLEGLGQGGHLDPILVADQGVEEPHQPAVVVNVFFRFRPGAEFFAVVAEDGDRVGLRFGHLGQIVDGRLRIGERNRVAQPLAAGEDRKHAAFVFGDQMARELLLGHAGAFEMEIVENRVFDAGIDQIAGEILLPNAFGNPHAANGRPQAVLQPAGVAADLADAVAGGNHRQNRLEKRPAQNFNAALIDQTGQAIDIGRLMGVEPFHQRAAHVQRNLQRFVTLENIQKRAGNCRRRLAERRGRNCRRADDCAGRELSGFGEA